MAIRYSIVIAVLNGAESLKTTLTSVIEQTYSDWEIIVQDGGSTDGTLETLRHYGNRVNWLSEPDTGICDAWNKALTRVTGDWTLFLGADDRLLHKHVLAQCYHHLADLPDHIRFAYGALLLGEDGSDPKCLALNRPLRGMYHQFLQNMGLPFPSTFIHSSLLREQPFDTDYAIAGDYAFTARHITRTNVARLPVWVTFMRRGGISDSPKHAAKLLAERARVLRTQVAPRADEFINAIADHLAVTDTFLEKIPE